MTRSLLHLLPLFAFSAFALLLGGCPTDAGEVLQADAGPEMAAGRDASQMMMMMMNGHDDAGMMMMNGGHDAGGMMMGGSHDAAGMMMMGMNVSGDVSGQWSGQVNVTANATVQANTMLEILAGTTVTFAPMTSLTVNGTLMLDGTAQSRITINGSMWIGLKISGSMQGGGTDVSNGSLCLAGLAGSTINVNDVNISSCSQTMRLANGGTFTHTTLTGGQTVSITGGILNMTDSVIDLQGAAGPDCTDWAGGSAVLDHVRFTACHCPLHFNSTDSPIQITNSIFDRGAVPCMIAASTATFTHNHFLGQVQMDDIGGSIHANIAGNYWGGNAPTIQSGDPTQFTGATDFSTAPFTDVGPRP